MYKKIPNLDGAVAAITLNDPAEILFSQNNHHIHL